MSTATVKKVAPTKVVTGKVRFSYLNVFAPRAVVEGADPRYSVCLLIPKSDKDTLRRIKTAIDAAKQQGASIWGGKIPANLKLPLRDGDEERPDQPEYEGVYFINANSLLKPGLVDTDLNAIIDQTELYSGCYGRASVSFFPFNTAGNRGVGVGLNNLQKLSDGDSLTGRSRAEDDFGDGFDDEEEESFLS
ncbi:MAG: DUF2815 family protein [Actinobacteria bacterium]|nr:DUF2815 family protein [Actinomycetota bacterium]